MADPLPGRASLFSSLSARLLGFIILFVMVSEVLIYAPSITRFRIDYLNQKIAIAHLASLALEVPPDNMVSEAIREELLAHAGSKGIVLRRPGTRSLVLADDMPPRIDAVIDMREAMYADMVIEAFLVMMREGSRHLRVIGPSPRDPEILVETVIDEAPLRRAMYLSSGRILALSLVISVITAGLVYVTLQWLLIRPMRGLSRSMVAFRGDPEDAGHLIEPSHRRDEIGMAERELAEMQLGLRAALQQKTRLAALGTAVAKVNHDLRNILTTVRLVSDQLASSMDPKVRRIAPTMLAAIDRAVKLCTQTLTFVQDGPPPPRRARFGLRDLVEETGSILPDPGPEPSAIVNQVPDGFTISADRDQLYRALANLVRNACEAGARHVTVRAWADAEVTVIEIADDGPGLPAKVQDKLFQAFAGSGRSGGTGLGLAIARELVRGHGGDIALQKTGAEGTVFRLSLPIAVTGSPPRRKAKVA